MLEKPNLQDEKIVTCLQNAFGVPVAQLAFLPLGADRDTFVYRAVTSEDTAYFVKLRRGVFNEIVVTLPKFLFDQGIQQIIPPLTTKTGQLWASLDAFTVMLYPFIEGRNGYEVPLTEQQWQEFGAALKRIHTTELPPSLASRIPQETYSPHWRELAKHFLARLETETFTDPIASQLAAFLQTKRTEVHELIDRTERLAQLLQAQPPATVLCHFDVHAGNLLLTSTGALYIVDWDNPLFAPKERDLMFIGGGQLGDWQTPQAEEKLFYASYGQTEIDPVAMAYYRYERIIDDIAVECEQILSPHAGDLNREQELKFLMSNFLPNSVLALAYQSDKTQFNQ
ncbi:MAG: aminoglycoside phosphotransferase family protein [Caldilineaceae bacterium]